MASEGSSTKPRFIKRLDFENCVFSGVKIRSKCKSRLRARYFRDLDNSDSNAEGTKLSSSATIVSPGKTPPVSQTSPVLLIKKSQKKKSAECTSTTTTTTIKSSPVFRSRMKLLRTFRSKRKINFGTQPTDAATTSFDPPKSPVFKRSKLITEKLSAAGDPSKIKGSSRSVSQHLGSRSRKIKSFDSEKFEESCYRIEESSQESKQSLHISSVSSSELKIPNTQVCPLDAQIDMETSSSSQGNPGGDEHAEKSEIYEKDSLPCRKNLKRSGLLARLEAILKKQNSEGSLRQHQGKLHNFEKLAFLQCWMADANFVLKCLSTSLPRPEIKYLIVDRRLVPNVPNLKKGSLLHVYPPWVKVNFGEGKVSVLINVIFLEVLKESSDFILDNDKSFESLPPEQFKDCEDELLNNALFSCHVSPFLL